MRYRQVHLDFHTSGELKDIGKEFDKAQFQKALQLGHVDSITLFSKCHHGYSFHPTKANEIHPQLSFDLLKEQLEACHEIEVKAPIYISAGFDEKDAVRHPEWLLRQPDESITYTKDFTVPGFHLLCYNTGYLPVLLAQIAEVMECYHPEGIFLDISSVQPCFCAKCRQDIVNRGQSYLDQEAVIAQAERVYANYTRQVEAVIRSYSADCTIFHNGGHIVRGNRPLAYANTHLELESLPTGGWGYDHFPMSASYVMNLGKEYLGMTGKFHTTWGEFGGFKHPNALRYEASLSLAFGAKCSIGDQLHPSGAMNETTYRLIGQAYEEVATKEIYCQNGIPCCEVAVLGEEAINTKTANRETKNYGDIGANRMLLEGNYLYTFIDLECDFNQYKVIILPDTVHLTTELASRLHQYMEAGGRILASGGSGLDGLEKAFLLEFGCLYQGLNTSLPDYYVPLLDGALSHAAYVMYEQGYRIKNQSGIIAGKRRSSYFNRTAIHFSSHQHSPDDGSKEEESVIRTALTSYIGWNIFTDYGKTGSLHAKKIVSAELDYLLGTQKTLTVTLPDRGIATLWKQEIENRYILHLLFAHTTIRGYFGLWEEKQPVEVIEDIVPLHNVAVSLQINGRVKQVYLAPQKVEIPFESEENRIHFLIPEMECHQMIAIELENTQ